MNEMTRPREPWNIRPAKKTASVSAAIKAEVEAKARDLIQNVLRPKHVVQPREGAKWFRNYFYFFSVYACPGPNALSPTFESKFARIEYLGNARFALYFMRHTGEWVGIYDQLSLDECMRVIQDDPWFVP